MPDVSVYDGIVVIESIDSQVLSDLIEHDWTGATNGAKTISASTEYSGSYPAWKCADGGVSTWEYWVASTDTGWWKCDFGSGYVADVRVVEIRANDVGGDTDRMPRDFTIQGSNNDSDWTTLKTVTGETGWSVEEKRSFICDVTGSYRYVRINVTDNNGDAYLSMAEVTFWGYLFEVIGISVSDSGSSVDSLSVSVDAPTVLYLDISDNVGASESIGAGYALLISVNDAVAVTESDIEASRWDLDNPVFRFYFTLTGSADGVEDVTIPIKSFQARLRDGDPTYLQVVIPGTADTSYISARPNGEMVIKQVVVKAGTTQVEQEIVRVDLEDLRLDEGAKSQSITLVGHKTETYSPKAVCLTGLTYKRTATGKRTLRTAIPDLFLRPGDNVTADGETWQVGLITLTVDTTQQVMEVTEDDDVFSLSLADNVAIMESSEIALS